MSDRFRPFLMMSLVAACMVLSGAHEVTAEASPPYRRFIPLRFVNVEGSRFKLNEKGTALEGEFPDKASLEGRKARVSAKIERELPPGSYFLFLSIPFVDSTVVRAAVPDLVTVDGQRAPVDEDEDEDDLAELEEADGGETKGYKKESGGLSVEMEVTLGKTKEKLIFPRQEGTFVGGVVVDAEAPFRDLSVRVLSMEPRIVVNQLYLTSRPGDSRCNREFPEEGLVCRIDQQLIRAEMNGQPSVAAGPEPANWLRNGSFEVGAGGYEWCMPYQSSQTINPRLLDRSVSFEGEQSLCLRLQRHRYVRAGAPSVKLMHKVLKLKPNTTYHFRGMFRADAPARVSLALETAYGPTVSAGGGARLIETEWRPVTATFETTAEDRGYYLTLAAVTRTKSDTWREPYTGEQLKVWADALVLSAEKPEGFAPAAPVEVGVNWEVPGKVFYLEEPVRFDLLARHYKAEGAPAKVTVRYRVVDYFNLTAVDTEISDWDVAPGTSAKRSLDLSLGKTGAFRLLVEGRADSGGKTVPIRLQEYAFCVLRRPPDKMHRTFGAYINVTPEPLEIMSRAGIRKTVTLSSSNDLLSNWAQMEPERGEFAWRDDLVEAAKKHKVEIVLDLEAQKCPAWALDPEDKADAIRFDGNRLKKGSFSRKAWGRFVENVVRHYKDSVHTWLIVDEPYHYFSMKSYFDVLKTASQAAKRADPDCKVLAHCCYYGGNLPALEKMGLAPLIDGISGYSRNPGQGAKLQRFVTKYGKSLMTVEYSWQLSIYQTIETPQGSYDPFWRLPYYRNVGAGLAALPLRSMAWSGSTGFNRYDARYPGADFVQLDNFKSMFEYDGALKPSAVAFAVAAQLLDGFRGVGQLKLNDQFESFLFDNKPAGGEERFVLAFWSKAGLLCAPLDVPEGVKACDIMGNPQRQPPKEIMFMHDVNYLVGPKAHLEAAKALVTGIKGKPVVHSEATTELDEESGQYFYRVKVTNLIETEPMKVTVGIRGQRNFWELPKDLGELAPGATAETTFGLNAYEWETDEPGRPGHYLFIEALGTSSQ